MRNKEAERLSFDEAQRPFGLGRGPLLRATLLALGPDEHLLLLVLHQIVGDGRSMRVLIHELGALYTAFYAGRPSPLPDLPIQYADFAAWQRSHLSGDFLDAELTWWRGYLEGLPRALDLPTDRPHRPVRSLRGAVHDFTIERDTHAALTSLSRRQGTTPFMTLLAVFAGLLQRTTGQDDLAVGTPIAGRHRPETEPLIGYLANTLVLRADLAGGPSLLELMDRVRRTTLAAHTHQDVPFERLIEDLAPNDLRRPPLVQALFVVRPASDPLVLPGFELATSDFPTDTTRFELTCTLAETEHGLAGTLKYSRDLFDVPTVQRLIAHFGRFLTGALAEPHRPLVELPILAPAESHQLLREWSDSGRARRAIGSVPSNVRVYVLDEKLAPVPLGSWGELCIADDPQAPTDEGRADLTAERFMPNAWSGAAGSRLYRTGEIVRYRPDGDLEFRSLRDWAGLGEDAREWSEILAESRG